MALLDDIANRLEADGVGGGSDDWVIIKGAMYPSPIRQIAIIETPGESPSNESVQEYIYPGFSVMVRIEKNEYEEGRAKMQEVFDSLHKSNLGNSYVDCLAIQSAPFFIGFDADEQPQWTLNFRVMSCL